MQNNAPTPATFEQFRQTAVARVDQRLQDALQSNRDPRLGPLYEAMQYTVMAGGKRVRPMLCLASASLVTDSVFEQPQILTAAASLELIHAYSLVHDDMPAMDDDDLRRGQPTVHIKYDEATAILVGDGLQTLAFQILSQEAGIAPANLIQCIQILAHASGPDGMVGGQMIDCQSVGIKLSLDQLAAMHRLKTGALIRASVLMGAVAAGLQDQQQLQSLGHYADQIGLAFQIRDDILDCIADTETLGKQQGADIELDKPTYVSALGLEGAQQKLAEVHASAISALLQSHPNAEQSMLKQVADYICDRKY